MPCIGYFSQWRRAHQWQAGQAHRWRRARHVATAPVPDVSSDLPDPLCIAGLPALTPVRWEQIAPCCRLSGRQGVPTASIARSFLDAMVWVMTTGTSWRQLPAAFGPWETVYYRFQRWKREGLWDQIRTILLS